MRKILFIAILCCFIFSGIAQAARFYDFPSPGICTGDYVRYREEPDTESEILGRLFTGDKVIVLSQTAIDGEIWYEIEDPNNDKSSAWVYGKYIRPLY